MERGRRIDVGFGIGAGAADFAPGLDAVWLADESSRYALLGAGHPLAGAEVVSLAELPMLVPGRDLNAALHDHMIAAVRGGGAEPRTRPAPASFAAAAAFVATGAAWTLVTRATHATPPPGTAVRRVRGMRRAALGPFAPARADDARPALRTLPDCLTAASAGVPRAPRP